MGIEIGTNMAVDLTLNGKPASLASARDTPLLWALRDEKQLVGVKFGCGVGLCGACTVMVDGAQQRSCQTMVGDIAGKSVTTIEGLSGTVARAVICRGKGSSQEVRGHIDELRRA